MGKNGQKKEKGTINSTQDSAKNQMQYSEKNNSFKRNTTNLIDYLITEIQRNMAYLSDENQIRWHGNYISKLKQIKRRFLIDPRYPHAIVQKKIDNLFERDNQIKGASVDFLFSELKNNLENFNPNVRSIF